VEELVARRPVAKGKTLARSTSPPMRVARRTPAQAERAPGRKGKPVKRVPTETEMRTMERAAEAVTTLKMEVGVQHATVELNEKGECKRDPEFWAPPLKLPTGGAVYLERFKKAVEKGSNEGKSPTADEVIEPPAFLRLRKVGTRSLPARWAQMGHTEVENFLMHLGRFYLSISTREASPPNTPERAADWQRDVNKSRLYVQQTTSGALHPTRRT
jgi:hypothetical protein